jgi:hypothetical protein
VSTAQLACVVEGHGDEEAVPILIRRIAASIDPTLVVKIATVIRTPRSRLVRRGELEQAVERAARKLAGGGVLVVLDSDDDCPARLGPELLRRARQERGHLPIAVVLAKREFEAWFLAAAESLRGIRTLGADLRPPPNPEEIRDAKGWLTAHMARGQRYVPALHQAALAAQFDLDQARRADSFDKCYRDVARLITASK